VIRGQTPFAHKIAGPKQGNGRFFALFGDHAKPYSPLLNVEDSIGTLSLGEDGLLRVVVKNCPADACTCQKSFGIEAPDLFLD
jgi:hypothetical protein